MDDCEMMMMQMVMSMAIEMTTVNSCSEDFRDTKGLRRECSQGQEWGVGGKSLIHPDQVLVANEVFAPSE